MVIGYSPNVKGWLNRVLQLTFKYLKLEAKKVRVKEQNGNLMIK